MEALGTTLSDLEPCTRCRKRLPVTAVFCPRCGIRVREARFAQPIAPLPQRVMPTWDYSRGRSIDYASPRPREKKPVVQNYARKKGGGVWAIAVIGLMVARGLTSIGTHSTVTNTPPRAVTSPYRYTPPPPYKPPTYSPTYTPPTYPRTSNPFPPSNAWKPVTPQTPNPSQQPGDRYRNGRSPSRTPDSR